jgi:hypothetical protein
MNEPNRTSMPTCPLSGDATLAASSQSYDRRQARRHGRHVNEDVPNRALSVQSPASPSECSHLGTQNARAGRPAAMAAPVKGFGCRPLMAVPRSYGDSTAVPLERERNFSVMARTLGMRENSFLRACDFKELHVIKRTRISTSALCA